jgi:arylsulfatase A-like enzyme
MLAALAALALLVMPVALTATPAAADAAPAPDRRPNIVFLFADDWGRYANCYAAHDARPTINALLKTPHLDGLAREGVLFRNAFVPSPSCTPCRSSLLSGQYFFRTGRAAILLGAAWDPAIPSYPLLLRDAGYHIGKSYKVWSPGTPADAPYGRQTYAYEAAGTRFNKFSITASRMVREGMTAQAAKQKLYDEVRGNVRAFLAARKPGQPFCYWCGPTVTHRTWEKGSGQTLWGIDPDALQGRLPGFTPDVPEVRADFADYMGEIQAWDAAVGVILEELRAAGELDNTLIVASGDHGMPGVPGGKCNLYDHGVAVALVARGPGIAGGRVVDDFVNLMDLAPTFLEAGGVTPPAVMAGRSLLGVLRSGSSGQVDESRTWVVTGRERHADTAREDNLPYPHRGLRTRDYLYIRNFAPDRWPLGNPAFSGRSDLPTAADVERNTFVAFPDMDHSPTKAWLVGQFGVKDWAWHYDYAFGKRPAEELYDLRTDPEQMRNVAADPAHAAVRTELAKRLIDVLTAAGDPRVTGDGETFDRPPFTDVAPNSPGLQARRLKPPPAPAENDSSAAGGAAYRLPEWFESRRGHLHTRLGFGKQKYFERRVGKAFASVGAKVYTRHVKSGDESPMWPTLVGKPNPLAVNRNFAAEMVADAHKAKSRMIGYYWETSEKALGEEHPDWLCRDVEGKPIKGGRGDHLCLNTPYRDLVRERLLELVDMGVDGIYFDYVHMPRGCWCAACRRGFRETTGREPPATSSPTDPALPALTEFNNAVIENAFREWRAAVHARNPDCVMVVSSSGYASLLYTHMSTRLFPLMDSNKTEYGHPYGHDRILARYPDIEKPERDIRMAIGWSLCRDGAEGRPAHVWLPGMQDADECRFAVAGILTHGCIANIDMNETKIPDATLAPAFELCDRVSPAFAGTQPLRWACVHFSERGRRRHNTGPRAPAMIWTKSTARTIGAYRALFRDHLPVGLITDEQLERDCPAECAVLFLPNPEALTDDMQAAVKRFRGRGGLVIKHDPDWDWTTREGIDAATAAVRARYAKAAAVSPVRVSGGPPAMHASVFVDAERRRFVVPLCNEFAWVDPHAKDSERILRPPQGVGPIDGVRVLFNLPQPPARFRDAVTGQPLQSRPVAGGIEVEVPRFEISSVVVAEL